MSAWETPDVYQRIAALARDLHSRSEPEADVIAGVAHAAAREVPGAHYAGITLAHHARTVRTLASTHDYPVILDDIQQRHLEGPCLSGAWVHDTVKITDMHTETRWPKYQRDARRETPIRSVMSFRLFTSQTTLGALNVYSEEQGVFDDTSEEIGYILATHAALAWDTVRRDEQFRSALASRDAIGQAKGIIMERFDVDAVRAFGMLRKLSQDTNTPLVEVARRLSKMPRNNGLTTDCP